MFALPSTLPIDPALRSALDAIVKAEMPRMVELVRAWTSEGAASPPPSTGSVEWSTRRSVENRIVNEMALLHLESPGAAYDDALRPAILQPAYCRLAMDQYGWQRQAILLQGVDPAKRDIALAGEQELLAKWGRPRPGLPALPSPRLNEEEEVIAAALRAKLPVTAPVMPPVLAWTLLVDKPPAYESHIGCALHQWGLARGLAAAERSPGEELQAYRYAVLPLSHPSLNPSDRYKPASDGNYPDVAKRFGVEGKVTLRVTLDADGKLQQAMIVRRDITVDGQHGPIGALGTLLDDASVAQVRSIAYKKPDASALKEGKVVAEQTINWRLEP